MEQIQHHFPHFSKSTLQQLKDWSELLKDWNTKINLISRKDAENLIEHHLLHSLSIAKAIQFSPGTRVIDVGTGGGLPGLPLAIVFPDTHFTLVDSIGKKIRVIDDMADKLGLKNITTINARVETLKTKYDFILGRAVTALPRFIDWTNTLVRPGKRNSLKNGLLYLKGTAYQEELKDSHLKPSQVFDLSEWFPGDFFNEKFLLHFTAPILQRRNSR